MNSFKKSSRCNGANQRIDLMNLHLLFIQQILQN